MANAFGLLNKELQGFVSQRFNKPTPIQNLVIPHILRERNVLVLSETGSGKTEACLLPVMSKWLQEKPKPNSILYITPLKSLNRDLQERILWWSKRLGLDVSVRHGDTSPHERRMQTENPPDMLILTPETLQAILVGRLIREHLKNVKFVVIDEVHELVPNKRGLQLSVGLERLKELIMSSGGKDPQMILLSATVGTPERIVDFFSLNTSREVRVLNSMKSKALSLKVEAPKPETRDSALGVKIYAGPSVVARVRRIRDIIKSRRSVLLFTNTREFAEVLSSRLRTLDQEMKVETHHSSLSKEVRIKAEDDFKKSELKSLVCTSSLELGIDIGQVDMVIQYQSPRQVAKLLQRAGRSGHSLTRISEGVIISGEPDDLFESAVIARHTLEGRIEPTKPYTIAFDVLAHQVVGIALEEYRITHKKAFGIVKRAYPFRNLSWEDYQATLKLVQKLGFLWVDSKFAPEPVLRRRKRSWEYYYRNLSTIPDVKNYRVIDIISSKHVGSLDAEFVALHGSPGSAFITKGQAWRIVSIDRSEVVVEPMKGLHAAIPAWEGELIPVPFEVAQAVAAMWEETARTIRKGKKYAMETLMGRYPVTREVAEGICRIVRKQSSWGFVPSRREVLAEYFADEDGSRVIFHTHWGSLVNDTVGRVLSTLLTRRMGSVGLNSDPYRITFKLQPLADWKAVVQAFRKLNPKDIRPVLESSLPNTELFTWRFVHTAKRFGIISRDAEYGKAYIKKLVEVYAGTPAFREALNEVMQEKLDIEKAESVMKEVISGNIGLEVRQGPSPLGEIALSRRYEIVAPERPEKEIFSMFRNRLLGSSTGLVCYNCGKWATIYRLKDIPEKLRCPICEASMISVVPQRHLIEAQEIIRKHLSGGNLTRQEQKHLDIMLDSASLVSGSGRDAVLAMSGRGVGVKTAGRILGRQATGDELLKEILEAEKKYVRTRRFWKD